MNVPCRICYTTNTHHIPLYEGNAADMMETLATVVLTYEQRRSAQLCLECYNKIRLGYDIRREIICAENHYFLSELDRALVPEGMPPPIHERQGPVNVKTLPHFVCLQCFKDFYNSVEYYKHQATIHNDCICGICSLVFDTADDTITHLSMVHEDPYL